MLGFVGNRFAVKGPITALALWALAILIGMRILWVYDATPGVLAAAKSTWPYGAKGSSNGLKLAGGARDTLVMLVHPQCACSRASLNNLGGIVARSGGKIAVNIVFYEPAAKSGDAWEHSDLVSSARGIHGATVLMDPKGVITSQFGAETSGQTLLYSSSGSLLFNGGITDSRGNYGDNAGSDAIVALATIGKSAVHTTNVYGCSLRSTSTDTGMKSARHSSPSGYKT